MKEEHARLSVKGEHGSIFQGFRLDVKMAIDNRGSNRGGRGGRGGRVGRGGRGGGPPFAYRDRSPHRDDHRMDPFDDPYGPPRRYPPPPPRGDCGMREPHFRDPYRRGGFPPEPWMPPVSEDPYRSDSYRDPYGPRAPPHTPIECEVFVVNSKLRAYGEAVEQRVKKHSIITALSVIPEGRTAPQMIEELTARSGHFAIFINPQNEEHRSLTVNILHGTPQEHRNMPMDDAITLVERSFQKYVDGLREKANAAAAPAPVPPLRVFLPPSKEVAYLLNLLADNRALTVLEINSIIKYLNERREKLVDAGSRPLVTDESYVKSPSSFSKSPLRETTPVLSAKEQMELTQKELTNKILSIFNSAGGSIQGVPPASSSSQQQTITAPAPLPPPPPPSSSGGSSSLINFDNPNVQAALDNLIQSSPNLLKNINTSSSVASSQMGSTSSVPSSQAAYMSHRANHSQPTTGMPPHMGPDQAAMMYGMQGPPGGYMPQPGRGSMY